MKLPLQRPCKCSSAEGRTGRSEGNWSPNPVKPSIQRQPCYGLAPLVALPGLLHVPASPARTLLLSFLLEGVTKVEQRLMEQKAELTSTCLSAAAPEVRSQRGLSLSAELQLRGGMHGGEEKKVRVSEPSLASAGVLPPFFAENGGESIGLFEACPP